MSTRLSTPLSPDWASASGDVWARRWRDTDRGLSGLAPRLLNAIVERAPAGSFAAFEVGSGPGSTTLAVAEACQEASIAACDVSPALVNLASQRASSLPRIRVLLGDAEEIAAAEGPFDLIFSRHGVMFFPDPVLAFRRLRRAATPRAPLVFSCFRSWDLNPWASALANAALGRTVTAPGHEAGGFAFADPDYVRQILSSAGWTDVEAERVDFRYLAGEGEGAVDDALSYLLDIGPASRLVQSLPEADKNAAAARMRAVIEQHAEGSNVSFPAAAWIWSANTPAS